MRMQPTGTHGRKPMREVAHWAIEVFAISAGIFAMWVIYDSISEVLKGGK